MDAMKKLLFLLAALAVCIAGCCNETTVILPPDTRPETPTAAPTMVTTAQPTAAPTKPPTAAPTEPPTAPPTEPPTVPPTEPPTKPPTEPPTEAPTEPPVSASYALEILEAINQRRRSTSHSQLSLDADLSSLAEIRATECTQSFSSIRPDGRNWITVLSDDHYSYTGDPMEIRGYSSQGFPADILVETWMSVDANADAILSETARYCGIGIADSGSTLYIVVIIL